MFSWGSVVLFLKAVHCHAPSGVTCWTFAKAFTHNILVMPVHDFNEVQYVPMEWLSPFTACVVMGGGLPESWVEMPVCKETGPVVPFLRGAADEAFWSLPISSVKRLGKEMYKLNLTGADVDVLADLINHILKRSDLELAQIPEKRCVELDQLQSEVCSVVCVCVCVRLFVVFSLVFTLLEVSQPGG